MNNNTLAIYIHELRNQVTHLEASFDLFNQSLASKNPQGVLFSGQLILSPASQIASLLWPARARSKARGEALRKVLGLEEKHVLNDRRLTELLEHSDTKLEEWIAATKGQQIIFDFVGPRAELDKLEGENGEKVTNEAIYRAHDPESQVYIYRGVGFNLKAIAGALSDVAGRIQNVYAQMFPEQVKREQEEMAARKKAFEEAQAKAAEQEATAAE